MLSQFLHPNGLMHFHCCSNDTMWTVGLIAQTTRHGAAACTFMLYSIGADSMRVMGSIAPTTKKLWG